MSDTPRTDAEAQAICKSGIDWHYSAVRVASFSRQLERENNSLRAELERLRDIVGEEDVKCIDAVLGDDSERDDDPHFDRAEREIERERAIGDEKLDIADADL